MATPNMNRPLTKTQLEYALAKLDAAKVARCTKIIEGISHPGTAPALNQEAKYKLIASGKAKLLPYTNDRSMYLFTSYSYPEFELKLKKHNEAMKIYTDKCVLAQKPINAAYNVAKDTLIMGNAEAALAVIEAFASGK